MENYRKHNINPQILVLIRIKGIYKKFWIHPLIQTNHNEKIIQYYHSKKRI